MPKTSSTNITKILFVGDIVARHGRNIVKNHLSELRREYSVDCVIANGENLTTGHGLTLKAVNEMHNAGVDFFTTGNHVWRKEEFVAELNKPETKVIRPANYPFGTPGRGYDFINLPVGRLMVINLLAKEGIPAEVESPFWTIDEVLKVAEKEKPWAVLVDFHAEMTSEKVAMGHYLDGRVMAILGTHTHVPTADARILPKGSAYVSDAGMTGPLNSVLGIDTSIIIERFKTGLPQKFEVAKGPGVLNALLLEVGADGKALSISRIDRVYD
jgi:metallophosphoesterase (TIGR00282 family)